MENKQKYKNFLSEKCTQYNISRATTPFFAGKTEIRMSIIMRNLTQIRIKR